MIKCEYRETGVLKGEWLRNLVFFASFVFCFFIQGARGFGFAYEAPRYEIAASLDSISHEIRAKQKITFTNNSSQATDALYFHVYPHRQYSTKEIKFIYRYAGYFKVNPFPEGFQNGDLKINSVCCAGKDLMYSFEGEDKTILKITLGTPLKSQESIEIILDFEVAIPHAYGKFGWHKNIVSLARWYPILSVLDDNGWHNYPFYLYHQPYFSDASYYKVTFTLDDDLKVASTGYLRQKNINTDGTQTLILETDFPVRDFALGISEDFCVYTLKKGKIRINSYYLKGDEERARLAAENASALMEFYSGYFCEYPYNEFDIVPVFLGYGGCQSSGLVFLDTRVYKVPRFLNRYFDFLVSHETGHQWFYNIAGSDEYKEMFMDEGINSYWTLRHLENKYGPDAKVMTLPKYLRWFVPNFTFRDSATARYIYMAKNGLDRPVIGPLSSFMEPSSIFAITYGKGSAVVDMLEKYVGEDVFNRIMKRYFSEFRFLNIGLNDFIRICEEESSRDLDSFFTQWLMTKKTADFSVTKRGKQSIVLKNRGSVEMPVDVRILYEDATEEIYEWDGVDRIITVERPVKEVEVDPDNAVLDVDRINNYSPRKLSMRPVPLYFFAYEIPLFNPLSSRNITAGPSIGPSQAGLASSVSQPYDFTTRMSAEYDFDSESVETKAGYEINHLFGTQTSAGLEIFSEKRNNSKERDAGGKIYLRKELWPANYGLFGFNDHVTVYLIRNKKFESTFLEGKEGVQGLNYREKDQAIFGITGAFGRYGPYPDPVYGWKFIPTQEFAGHFLGGGESFWRTTLDWSNYYEFIPRIQHRTAWRIKVGWAEPADKNLFQLGGASGLRGYSAKTIEGARMFLTSFEYRFPLISNLKAGFLDNIFSLDKIQAVGFFDAGGAWHSRFCGHDFKKDIGAGLRLHFNVLGLLEKIIVRLDFAQAINDSKEDPHLWLGLSHVF